MSQRNGLSKRTEKGLLTPDNCVVALIDHQPQMLFGVSSTDRQSIINNTLAFAKAAQVFGLPVVLSTVETKSFSGYMWPQLAALFPGRTPIERSSMNSWDDKNFVAAIEKTGKKKIVLAGLWTETCVALPTIEGSSLLQRTAWSGRLLSLRPPPPSFVSGWRTRWSRNLNRSCLQARRVSPCGGLRCSRTTSRRNWSRWGSAG